MLKARNYMLAATALAAALILSACAGGSTDASSASDANDADVTFAQMMIPHHEQAVAMSEDFLAKDGVDQRVADLATQIKAAQEPEIEQLKTWLASWGADEGMSGSMPGMPGMGSDTGGTMSEDDMMALQEATGADADKLFLEQMIVHHSAAIEMAQTEVDEGENADATAMAESIVTSQTEEIQTMKELLATM